ncbi:MAG: class I SAM-dependent methyltransferase [Acidobacteriota bacterium]
MERPGYLDFVADFSTPSIVRAYDEVSLWSAMFGLLLLEQVPLRAETLLDVGCGTGFPLIELAERLGPSVEVHGIDPWTEGLTRAREKIVDRGTPNITLHEGSAAAMPFDYGSFDLIVSNLGINNFSDRQAVVAECRRVAKTGATLALTTNLQGHMKEFYDIFLSTLEEAGDQGATHRLADHIRERATVADVSQLLEGAGFVVHRVEQRSAVMRFGDGTALLNHHFIKLGFLEAWKRVAGEKQVPIFTELQRRLDDRARREGELRLTVPMAYLEARAE